MGEAGPWVPGCPGRDFLLRGALIMPLKAVETRGPPPAGVWSAGKPHEIDPMSTITELVRAGQKSTFNSVEITSREEIKN